jgi:hypothetical protein
MLFADPQVLSWMISFVFVGREGIPGLVGPAPHGEIASPAA